MKLPDLAKRAAPLFGYLVTTFRADQPGIFQHLSVGDDPYNFRPLNEAHSILDSTVGTHRMRDPYLVASPDRRDFWMLGTDLDITKTSWPEAERHGSRNIVVSHSTDLVNWSETYPLPVAGNDAGMVWDPMALWSEEKKAYALFWSSNSYAANDPGHKGKPKPSSFYYTLTTDFKKTSGPQLYLSMSKYDMPLMNQEFLPLSNGQYLMFSTNVKYKATYGQVKNHLWKWENHFEKWPLSMYGGSGTSAFHDNADPNKLHLWVDRWNPDHTKDGCEAYEAHFDGKDARSLRFNHDTKVIQPAGLRHGSVTPLTKVEFDRLDKEYAKVKAAGVPKGKNKP